MVQKQFIKNINVNLSNETMNSGGAWSSAGVWDPAFLTRLLDHVQENKYTFIFDIGASTGQLVFFPLFDSNIKVWAFEPQKNIFRELLENIKLNNLMNNSRSYNFALSDSLGETTLYKSNTVAHSGLATLGSNVKRFGDITSETISISTLDHFVEEHAIPKIDLIKIDTEGHEYFVLKGGINTINKFKPDLVLEIYDDNLTQCGLDRSTLFSYLDNIGYAFIEQFSHEDYLFKPK